MKLTPQQLADKSGRLLVTMVDGRIAIVLPPISGTEQQAAMIARVAKALEKAGLGTWSS